MMASATKKIEASPFLVRRVNILEKLRDNKVWLEEAYKEVKHLEVYDEGVVSGTDVVVWMEANWEAVLNQLTQSHKDGALKFDYHYHYDYARPDATIDVRINLHRVEGYPYKKSEANTNKRKLHEAVKQAFLSSSDNKGNVSPSRYQRICQYISLFDQSDDEFIDAKFYSDLPSLIPSFKDQFNIVQQID
jgi:hypothetical protein